VPIFIVANKADFENESQVEDRGLAEAYATGFLRTSPKTGENR